MKRICALAVSPNYILAQRPDWSDWVKKLTQFAQWMGAVSIVWGAWGIVKLCLNLGWLTHRPLFAVSHTGVSLLHFSLGLLLAFDLVSSVMPNSTKQKLGRLKFKLAMYETTLGVVGMCMAVAHLLVLFIS